MKRVLILKSESDSSEIYASLLAENNFEAVFVPTLGFGFKNLEELRGKLLAPEKHSGLIFTSPRCVDAVQSALQDAPLPEQWKELHNYCVGEVTHNYIKSCLDGLNSLGKESGNANNLADYIKEQFEGNKSLPLLFPCGNLRTDALLVKLMDAGFLLDACEVYETIPHPDLAENLSAALKAENVEFIAFFSPSGVNCCYEYFTKNNVDLTNKKLIAIGPSTRKSMENKGLTVYRTAEKPSVEYLIKVLLNPDGAAPTESENGTKDE